MYPQKLRALDYELTPKLVDINELSRILSVPRGTLYNLVYLRRIPFVKIGRSLRFDMRDIAEFLKVHSQGERHG